MISDFHCEVDENCALLGLMQGVVVGLYRRFGTTYWSHLQGRRPLKMGPIGCPETTVRNYNYMLHISPEDCISLLNTDSFIHNIQSVSCLYISYVNTSHAYCPGYSQSQVSYRYAPDIQSLARCGYLKFSPQYVFKVAIFSLNINSDWLLHCNCNERMVHIK